MKSITVHVPALLKKVQEMSNDNMENVKLTVSDRVTDRDKVFPAFLHFEAHTKDGFVEDYESIDALAFFLPAAPSTLQCFSV